MEEENLRIKDAAIILNINYQTAKSIIRRFRATGKIIRSNRILKYANDEAAQTGHESISKNGVKPQLGSAMLSKKASSPVGEKNQDTSSSTASYGLPAEGLLTSKLEESRVSGNIQLT